MTTQKPITDNQRIAGEIIRQLGGLGVLRAMIGIQYECAIERGLGFKFKGCARFNYCRITLAGDLYTVKLMKARGLKITNERELEMIYADNLRQVFEAETGLALSLGTMGGQAR